MQNQLPVQRHRARDKRGEMGERVRCFNQLQSPLRTSSFMVALFVAGVVAAAARFGTQTGTLR